MLVLVERRPDRRQFSADELAKQFHQKYFNDHKSEFDEVCCSASCAFM